MHPDRHQHGRRGPVQVRRHRLLHQAGQRDVRDQQQRRLAGGVPQLPAAHRRPGRPRRDVRVQEPDAQVPDPRRLRLRGRAVRRRGLAGHGQAVPQRVRREAPRAGRVRDLDHLPDGLSRLLPRRRRLHQLGEEQRRGGRPWARQRRGQHRRLLDGHHRPGPAGPRADLRAVPEPRADLDARHRHRLRRARPGGRHQVRHPEVRQRQGRADHHLRHDQGEGRHQGLDTGPRVPVRPRRPDHQGVPARGHGQGHPAVRHLRREHPTATTRRASCGTSTRPRQRSSRSSTPPGASRG